MYDLPEVTRQSVPAEIEKKMKMWRNGFSRMPAEYIAFHRNLAEARLETLKSTYGFRVIEITMRDAGWFDGMRELNAIIETRSGKLLRLVWCDSNQDFMRKYESGGSGIFNAEALK